MTPRPGDALVDHVRAVLDRHLAEGETAVVAVSGGADSVALALLTAAARPDLDLLVAHVRHGLRDDLADAAAARAAADAVGARSVEEAVAVGAGEGPEDAARRARHDALDAVADEVGAAAVLLGHTADDQAETVLLRIARGTGPDGLAGMDEARRRGGRLVLRPLLGLRRAAVRAVPPPGSWVEDPTNADPHQRRARARQEVLPALGSLRPDEGDAVPALVRLADLARRESAALDAVAGLVGLGRYGPAVVVPRHLGTLPPLPAIHARLVRRAWRTLPGAPHPPPAALVDRIVDLPRGASLDGPGPVRVTAADRGWVLCPEPGAPLPERPLPVGGRVALPELGIELRCDPPEAAPDLVGGDPSPDLDAAPWQVRVAAVDGPLVVGGRGADGARDARPLLQQLVPDGLRHLVPLLRDERGRLLAVGSRAVADPPPGGAALVVTALPAYAPQP